MKYTGRNIGEIDEAAAFGICDEIRNLFSYAKQHFICRREERKDDRNYKMFEKAIKNTVLK